MRWHEFEAAAPELAALGRAGFEGQQRLCILGTLAADGWPRLSVNEIYFPDGHLLLGMMRRSRKALDLLRDPRLTLMTPQCERDPTHGDFKLFGRASDVTDVALRERYAEMVHAAIDWRPHEPYPLFDVDIERAAYITFGDDRRLVRWSAERGVEELLHPDDDPEAGAPSD